MKQNLFVIIIALILSVLVIGCEKNHNLNEECECEKKSDLIEYQEIEIGSQCVWDSIAEEEVHIFNSLEELTATFPNCSIEIDESIFETKTLLLFKGTATSGTMISEISYEIFSLDSSEFRLQIKIVGSIAQVCESETIYFSAIIDKIENVDTFVYEYKNIDCFEYYE